MALELQKIDDTILGQEVHVLLEPFLIGVCIPIPKGNRARRYLLDNEIVSFDNSDILG